MAMILRLAGVTAVSGGVLDLNGPNSGMASIAVLNEWQPRVAKRRRGALGDSVYEDVVEAIPLRVYGTTRVECVDALEALAAAMDQAAVWRRGANVGSVVLQHAIDGTALANPLQAAVLGTPGDVSDILGLPITFNKFLQGYEVNPVTLPVLRRGLWLGDAETEEELENETDAVLTVTFADVLANASPVSVQMISDDAVTMLSTFMLATSDVDDGINVASTYGSGSSGSTETSTRSFNGNCRRITPSSVIQYLVNLDLGSAITLNPRRAELFELFLVGRNYSETVSYQVTGQLVDGVSGFTGDLGSVRAIPTGGPALTDPSAFIVPLGVLGCASSLTRIQVRMTPSGTDTDTLEIDYAVAIKLGGQLVSFPNRNEMSSVGTLRVIQGQLDGDGIGTGTATTNQPRPRAESIYFGQSAVRFPTSFGNKSLWMQGDTLQVMMFGFAAQRSALYNVTDPIFSRSLTVARRPGYLVPR